MQFFKKRSDNFAERYKSRFARVCFEKGTKGMFDACCTTWIIYGAPSRKRFADVALAGFYKLWRGEQRNCFWAIKNYEKENPKINHQTLLCRKKTTIFRVMWKSHWEFGLNGMEIKCCVDFDDFRTAAVKLTCQNKKNMRHRSVGAHVHAISVVRDFCN